MKIAQIVCVYPPYKGGIGTAAKSFYDILKTKHQITNFSLQKNNPEVSYIKPIIKLGHGAFAPNLYQQLKNFDTIYLHYPFFGIQELIYFYKIFNHKKKLILHYHMDTADLSWYKKILSLPGKLIEKGLVKKADKIIVSSLDYLQSGSWNKYYQKWPEKFISLPFGVDTDFFKPAEKKGENNINQILFVGGLDKAHYFKGVKELFFSLNGLEEAWELHIAGQGNMEESYKKLAKDLKIEEKITFHGGLNREKLRDLYQKSSFLVLPSINSHEAFGIVLIEALACGLPVIASRLPGVRTVFREGKQGFYVPAKNITELREKIKLMIKEKDKLAPQTRSWVLENYRQEIISQKLLDIFNL